MISELSWRQIIAWIFHVIWNKQLLAASVHADHADGASNRVYMFRVIHFMIFIILFADSKNYLKGVQHPWTLFLKTVHFLKK